jgi:ABC-type transport system involved in multi-copper enzyme maturation permease subunit
LPIVILSLITGKPLLFGTKATIVALIIAFIYAIIYGLQGFAGETDRKTIDFLLSRPISPTLLIVVKFTINLAVYLFWLLVITQRVVFNWSILHLPKGIDGTVIVFVFPIIMSMGFFAGLIVRGAERLLITVGMTALMAGGCYFLWNQAFLLMAANYYWFDIPPHIVTLSKSLDSGRFVICFISHTPGFVLVVYPRSLFVL